jgi:hypothetical protein
MPGMTTRLRHFALAACAAALFACACSAPAGDTGATAGDGSVAPASAGEMSTDTRYPEAYREMRLPEAPDAEVMSTGQQDASAADTGLSLRVTTPMAVQQARDYFSNALQGEGWNVTASRPLPGIDVANLTATKGPATYRATFTANGNATQIDINVVQN